MIKRTLLILLGLFVLAQFAQPDRRTPPLDPAKDMLALTGAPEAITTLVVGACYDCHSDATDYPVWAYITPVNFWIQHHIDEGREVLNFSQWDHFVGTEAAGESGESMAEGGMPPTGYAGMHGHAQLTVHEQQQLIAWFNANLGEGDGAAHGEEDDQD